MVDLKLKEHYMANYRSYVKYVLTWTPIIEPTIPYQLIIPDQKVTAGALSEVVESFRMLLGTEGGVYLQLLRRSSQ